MTFAPQRYSWSITRLMLFSLPGMGVAEIITVSLCRICSLRCSLYAMRVKPAIGSP